MRRQTRCRDATIFQTDVSSALYNDRKVAEVVNKKFGRRAVGFVAQHGPAPYVLHIHLDLMPLKPPGGK